MVEFSVIICSIDDEKFKHVEHTYQTVLAGESYEIIRIEDATGLCEGYIRGIEACNGSTVILSHDDAAPVRPFAAKLRNHLHTVDIVGGAGTDRLSGPAWFSVGPPNTFGQVLNVVPKTGALSLSIFGVPKPLVTGIQAIDGFWMAARRSVLEKGKAWFDPKTFTGFHFYDLDFSLTAYKRGFKLGVATDLSLCHASSSGYNEAWKADVPAFMNKWKEHLLPPVPRNYTFASVAFNEMNQAVGVMDELVERSR
jgi:hypothetical protein